MSRPDAARLTDIIERIGAVRAYLADEPELLDPLEAAARLLLESRDAG